MKISIIDPLEEELSVICAKKNNNRPRLLFE